MKNNILLIIFIFSIFGCVSKSDYMKNKKSQPVLFEIVELEEKEDGSLMQLLIKLPINKLVFNKIENSFISNITVDLYILDENDKISYTNSWNEKITKNYYEDTKTRNFHVINHYLELPVGIYKINLAVNDFENHLVFLESGHFEVFENKTKGYMTFFYKENGEYQYYIESNESSLIDTLWMSYQIFTDNNTDNIENIDIKVEYFFENKIVHNISYDDLFKKTNDEYLSIPLVNQSFDKINVQIFHQDNIINKSLYFTDRVKIVYDLLKLVGPMQYILETDRYNEFYDSDSLEQIEFLQTYWKLDNSDINDEKKNLLKEFYKRVIYVNENFKHFNARGWSTDRGRIFIIHGKPKEIKNNFNENGEYEIWYYDNKEFIFINKFGIYQLHKQYK